MGSRDAAELPRDLVPYCRWLASGRLVSPLRHWLPVTPLPFLQVGPQFTIVAQQFDVARRLSGLRSVSTGRVSAPHKTRTPAIVSRVESVAVHGVGGALSDPKYL